MQVKGFNGTVTFDDTLVTITRTGFRARISRMPGTASGRSRAEFATATTAQGAKAPRRTLGCCVQDPESGPYVGRLSGRNNAER